MRIAWKRILLRRPDEGSGGGGGTESPSSPEASPSPPSGVETQIGTIPADIMSLFDGDPQVTPPAETPQGGGETPPSAPPSPPPSAAPGTPGAEAQPGAQQPQVPPSAQPSAHDPAVLAGQVQTLTQLISRQLAGGQPPPGAAPREVEVPLPPHQYQMTIPDGLDVALISDDQNVRKQAIGALVQGTAQTVHREVVKHMRAEFARALPTIIQQHITQSRNQTAVAQDFYGAFPQYAHPAFKPIVVQVAQQVAQETGARAWSVELRNAVGQRLADLVRQVANGGGQPPIAPAVAPSGPAAISPGNNSRPSMGVDPTQQFRDLLN